MPPTSVPADGNGEPQEDATGLPSPQSEADSQRPPDLDQTPHDGGSQEAGNDPDVPVPSVEAPVDEERSNVEETRSNASSDSGSGSGSGSGYQSPSEFSDNYNIWRPSPSPTLSERNEIDARMRRKDQPVPLRYNKENTHRNIEKHADLLKLLTDRLAYLEHEVETLRAGPRPVEPESPILPPPPPPMAQRFAITEYGNYQWFNRRNDGVDDHVTFVLEVQLVPDETGIQARSPSRNQGDLLFDREPEENSRLAESSPEISYTPFALIPHRVRINSQPLLNCLRRVCKDSLNPGNNIVFLSPFKMFVKHEDEIRAALAEAELDLQNIHNDEDTTVLEDGIPEPGEVSPYDPEFQAHDRAILHSRREAVNEGIRRRCEHLRLLVQFFDGPLKPVLDLYHSIRDGTASQVPFDFLWYLFEHGKEVVQRGGPLQVSRVLCFTGGRAVSTLPPAPPPPPPPPGSSAIPKFKAALDPPPVVRNLFTVDCYRWEFDGEKFGPVVSVCSIRFYKGLKDITSLPVYPLSFDKKSKDIKMQLTDRGNKFLSLVQRDRVSHRHYTGITLESNCTSAEEIDSRIIVDQRLAILEKPFWKPEEYNPTRTPYDDSEMFVLPHSPNDYMYMDHQDDQKAADKWFSERKHIFEGSEELVAPPEEDKILLSHFLYGFILRSRKWAKLHIDIITEIEDKNSFDDLVLPEGHAHSIKALVENHNRGPGKDKDTSPVDVSMDLVRGKGKGVIILLHGEPGVGKTSTAECIADYTSRPLYPITCGDIGETADQVEKNLEKTFQLAHKWGCVLLLDEADIFLQERNKEDMRRNAVVSVFLRVLEYYSGILFLTTNRVGIIDQAFRSRIHLSLFYKALDKSATITIWKMHLKNATTQFKKKGQVLEVDRKKVLEFAKDQYKRMKKENMNTWNGRQIRNAFQTAIALAEYRSQGKGDPKRTKLTVEEFKIVQETSDSFDEYLLETQKATQSAQARLNKTRSDAFKSKEHNGRESRVPARAKGRRGKRVEVESASESSTSIDDSESEQSSSDEDIYGDGDKSKDKKKAKQVDSSDGESDVEVEDSKSKTSKSKKATSRKREDDDTSRVEKGKGRRKSSKKDEESSEESEPEPKAEKRRTKK